MWVTGAAGRELVWKVAVCRRLVADTAWCRFHPFRCLLFQCRPLSWSHRSNYPPVPVPPVPVPPFQCHPFQCRPFQSTRSGAARSSYRSSPTVPVPPVPVPPVPVHPFQSRLCRCFIGRRDQRGQGATLTTVLTSWLRGDVGAGGLAQGCRGLSIPVVRVAGFQIAGEIVQTHLPAAPCNRASWLLSVVCACASAAVVILADTALLNCGEVNWPDQPPRLAPAPFQSTADIGHAAAGSAGDCHCSFSRCSGR